MADDIRIPVSADTTPMERDIANVASKARVSIRTDLDAKQLEAFSRPLGKITGQADEFSKSMEAANARVLAFGASVGVVNAIANAFKNLVTSTIEVEKSLNEIGIIGDKTFKNLNQVSAGLFSTAKELGVSFKDASDATLEFARQGKDLESSLQAARAALALTRTSGLDAAESVKGLTSAVNAFGLGASGYVDIVNKMSSVSDAFAVNNKDLIEGISRSASVAQEAGVSFNELTALITTLQEKTGRGGAVIGNALKTIFTRVQNPEILKDIRDLGIAVQDTQGNFLPATQIIRSLASEFNNLDANVRKSVLLKVGGGFQIDKLAAALNDVAEANGTFQRSLAIASSNTGDIFGRVEKMNQTIDSAFTNMSTSAKQLGSTIGKIGFADDFRKLLESGSSLFEGLNKAIGGGGEEGEGLTFGQSIAKGIVKGIGSVISGPGVFLFAGILLKLGADFAKFSVTGIQTLIGITSKSKEQESIQRSIQTVLGGSVELQSKLFSLEGNKTAQAQVLLNTYIGVANQMERISTLSRNLAPALQEGGVSFAGGNLAIKRSASGYVPNLAAAISSERQESPASSKIIVDHNFPMGGGQRGTMVYNSNETRIKNFGGSGGDAIIPNYPVSAAKGYVPNFAVEPNKYAGKYAKGGKGDLNIDAMQASIAGITLAGQSSNFATSKPLPINDKLLKNYIGSPFFDKLSEYDRIALTNVPVGNVYRFRKGLKEDEDVIKKDFVSKLNISLRPSILSFIGSEVDSLGLKTGGGLKGNLENLKTDLIGTTTGGYILEEILKIPTLTNAEKVAQYAAQSEKAYFDIQNLDSDTAEAYGLPKRKFSYADVKLGEGELYDGITKKYLNQAIYEGGGAKLKNAAKGYVPNFSRIPVESISNGLNDFYKNDTFDEELIKSRIQINSRSNKIEYPNYSEIDATAEKILALVKKTPQENRKNLFKEYKNPKSDLEQIISNIFPYLKSGFGDKIDFNDKSSIMGYKSNLTGALAELFFHSQKPGAKKQEDLLGVDFSSGKNLYEIKNRKDKVGIREYENKYLRYIGQKSGGLFLKNEDDFEKINQKIKNYNFTAIESVRDVKNAAKGYIPNFANTSNMSGAMMRFSPKYAGGFGLPTMTGSEAVASLSETKGTRLKGTNFGEKNYRTGGFELDENNIIASILGNNTFFQAGVSQASMEKDLGNFIERLTAGDRIIGGGAGGAYAGVFGSGMRDIQPKQIISANISGKFKNIDYSKLEKIFPRLWRAKGVESAWDMTKGILALTGSEYSSSYDTPLFSKYNKIKRDEVNKNVLNLRSYTEALRNVAIASVADYDKDLLGFHINIAGTEDEAIMKGREYNSKNNTSYITPFGSKGITNPINFGMRKEHFNEINKSLSPDLKKMFSVGGSTSYGSFTKWFDTNQERFGFKSKKQAQDELAMALNIKGINYDAGSKQMIFEPIARAAKGYIPNFARKKKKSQLDPSITIQNAPYDDQDEDEDELEIDPHSFEAIHNGYLVGSLYTSPSYSATNGTYIDKIEVDENYRKKGIAKALYTHLVKSLMPGSSIEGDIMPQHMEEWQHWGENNLSEEENKKLKAIKTLEGLKMIYPQLSRIDLSRDKAFTLRSDHYGINEKTPKTDPQYKEIIKLAKYAADANLTLVTFANKGFIPNFAGDALNSAIMRERMATGLSGSMISVSQDPRAANPQLNPSGLIVTNKIDEPNGPASVTASRMASAYRNAGTGFVPNFSKENITAKDSLGQALNINFDPIKVSSEKVASTNDKLNATIQQLIRSNQLSVLSAKISASPINVSAPNLNDSQRTAIALKEKEVKAALEKLISQYLDNGRNMGELNSSIKEEARLLGLSQTTLKTLIATNMPSGINASTWVRPEVVQKTPKTPSSEEDIEKSKYQNKKFENKNPSKTADEDKVQKSYADIAAKIFTFQGALSLASGFLSTFGSKAAIAGEALNELGQAGIALSQSSDLKNQITGGKGISGSFAAGKKAASEATGTIATAGAFLRGGGAVAAAGSLISGLAYAYATVQAVSAIDKGYQVLNGTFDKSRNYIDDLNASLSKYNIQLTDQQKKVGERIVDTASASGAGIDAVFNRIGLTSTFKSVDASNIIKSLSYTGLDKSGNTDLLRQLTNSISPQVTEKLFKQNNKAPDIKQIEAETQREVSKKLQEFRIASTQGKNEPEIKKIQKEIDTAEGNNKLNKKGKNKGPETSQETINALIKKQNDLRKNGNDLVLNESQYQGLIKDYIIKQVIPLQDTEAAEKQRIAALLQSANILNKQLDLLQNLSKLQSSFPSAKENELSIEKDILTTTEARRMEIDRTLKSLQEQRQLTSDIKDTALSFGREKITTYLGSIGSTLGQRKDTADNIQKAFTSVASASNEGQATEAVNNLIQKLSLSTNDTEDQKKLREQAIQELQIGLEITKANSAARQVQGAIESQNLAVVKQQNYEINVRKEAISTELTLVQKRLEYDKQALDLRRQTADIKFETSQIGRPQTRAALAQAEKNLADAQKRPQEDLKNQQQQYENARKQSLVSYLNQKNIPPEEISTILNKSPKEQTKELTTILNKESTGFYKEVTDSASVFYDKIAQAAMLISDKLNPQSAPEESLKSINFKNLQPETLKAIKEKLEKQNSNISEEDPIYSQLIYAINNPDAKKRYGKTTYTEESTQKILDAMGPSKVPTKESQDKNDAAIKQKERELELTKSKYTFKGGATEAATELQDQIDTFQNTLGKTIPMGFRDGMVSAMKELSNPNSTEPLRNRLLGVANAFLLKIQEAFMTNAANKLTSGIMGGFGVEAKASGGPIMGGSGNKDDVPAMLMGGEYVITKSAAQKYGPSFLNALNKGTLKKFATGGPVWDEADITKYQNPAKTNPYGQRRDQGLSFDDSGAVVGMENYTGSDQNKNDALKKAQTGYYAQNAQTGKGGFTIPGQNGSGAIMGQKALLAFATQQVTDGRNDVIKSSGGSSSINIGAGSSRMSLFGLRNQDNPMQQSYLEAKNKAMDLYFGGIDAAKDKANQEEQIRQEQERLRQEAKTRNRQMYQGLVRNFVISAGMAAASAGITNMANTGGQSALQGKIDSINAGNTGSDFSQGYNQNGEFYSQANPATIENTRLTAGERFFGYGGQGGFFRGSAFNSGNNTIANSRGVYSWEGGGYKSITPTDNQWAKMSYGSNAINYGGQSYYSASLRRAAGGYVPGNGMGDNVPTMLNGGEFVMSRQATQNIGAGKLQQMNAGPTNNSISGETLSQELSSKFDELIEKMNAVGTINITVTSDGKGGTSEKDDSPTADKQGKDLAKKVKDVVLQVLRDEKRLGGLLR